MKGVEPIREVVIAGGGTAGWMAAAALSAWFGEQLQITLVESEEIGTVGVGEATIPQIHLFNRLLGFDEDAFVRATAATFKLGIRFEDWLEPGHAYIHGFGGIGRQIGKLPFHQYWLRYRAEGGPLALDAFSANLMAAQAGKFGRPARGTASRSTLAHAYHFDAGLYAAFLRRHAETRGVRRVEGKIRAVRQHSESGHIRALCLDGGREIGGELFLDCTGFRALLIGETMGSAYEDWSHWLPCNRAFAVPTASAGPPDPFTRSTAREAGWQWHIPLQHRTGNGLVFSADYWSEDSARETLLANLSGKPLAEPRMIRFTTGKRAQGWVGNCVSLGLAGGFLEPLESTSIHMIQSAIARLVDNFPRRDFAPAAIAEYNAQTDFEYAALRDFLVLHYRLNRREGAFWRYLREMPLPDSLTQKLALFAENGMAHRFNTELFDVPSWVQVMLGQGLEPAAWHPMADAVSDAELARFIADTARNVEAEVAGLPAHSDHIAATCTVPN
ncbi:MAG: tryptophan 7-halogenase [Erythrobacter sp.]|nr:MAG: tryptophan 7-halogenase [Erythrobacter sp.]